MTQAEIMQKRKEHHQEICKELANQGYTSEDATVSILKANILAFVTALPFILIFVVLFFLLHSVIDWKAELLTVFTFPKVIPFLLITFIMGIPVHEFLHGFGWHFSCQKKWKSIQFGVIWESFTPYCYCGEAISLGKYYLGLLMPCTVLGILTALIGAVFGSVFWLIVGLSNILFAGGDLTIACILFKYIKNKSEKKILDHPSECGCTAFLKV